MMVRVSPAQTFTKMFKVLLDIFQLMPLCPSGGKGHYVGYGYQEHHCFCCAGSANPL